jgi:multidrug efflux pump
MRSITLYGEPCAGLHAGEALDYLETDSQGRAAAEARIDYQGQSREFRQSSAALFFTFALALLVDLLVLSAQFESFIHPLSSCAPCRSRLSAPWRACGS